MKTASLLFALGALGLAACAPAPSAPDKGAAVPAGACAEGEAKLATLGICPKDAGAFLPAALASAPMDLPEGCTWTMQETPIGDTGDVLVYRAATCKGVVTTLAHVQGAKSDSFTYATSAVFGDSAKGETVLTRFEVETPNPNDTILGQVVLVAETEEERKTCEIRPAGIEGWPADALVADFNAATKARKKIKEEDGPRAACGFYGIDTGETKYWQVKQGYALFFSLGQEALDFHPDSLTVLTKGADGKWAPKAAEPVGERN